MERARPEIDLLRQTKEDPKLDGMMIAYVQISTHNYVNNVRTMKKKEQCLLPDPECVALKRRKSTSIILLALIDLNLL